ncbi:ATP-binding protein [Rhizobium sp. L1K21]|uniref:ATP-binding protein n=1 Tax=Rhizobium sp. L1K21 TaxID=2954933 RepID=UPI002092C7E9|nr:ATP-binding protein [Rhizobium sp. L1K21]MCO6185918.1 ATP-binding protein [Rhizobium sp. L1K21]
MEESVSVQLFKAMRRPTLVTDDRGVILEANPAFLSTFELDSAKAIGQHLTDFLEPLGNWKAAGVNGLSMTYRHSGASSLAPSGRLQINRYESSGNSGFFIFIDSGTAFEAEEILTALSYIVENFPHPILIWGKSAELLKYNDAAKQRFVAISDLFHLGQDRQVLLTAARDRGVFGTNNKEHSFDQVLQLQYVTDKERGPLINELQAPDGTWHRVTAYFSPDGWGASFYEDISELRRAQSELSTRTREFELILQNVPDFVVVADADFRVNYVNASYEEATSRTRDSWIGERCLPDEDGDDGNDLEEMFISATPDSPSISFDEWMRVEDGGRRWIRWRCRVLFDGGERSGMIKIGRDITVEYEQEQHLRQQSSELAKKNESLERFAAVVSHDLKAPLRHIAIFADMVVEEVGKEHYEQLPQFAKHIQNSAVRMDGVIKRLLEYSKVAYKTVSRHHVPLSDIVVQAVQNLESQVENARAEILASDLPYYFGDPDLLRQLFQNLIGNAVKYCRPGQRPRVRIYCARESGNLQIFVEDNGIGIDPRYADSIFTAFRRLHKDETVYDGFGIGLALCKQIVDSHLGSIRLDTSYKGGARFVIELPLKS